MPSRYTLPLNRDLWSSATWEGVKLDHFLHAPVFASVGGGVLSLVGGVFAQMSSNDAVANTGLWAAFAGITASCAGIVTTIIKLHYDNREKARQHELALKREDLKAELVRKSAMRNRQKIRALVCWAHDAKAKYNGLPEPPDIDMDVVDAVKTPDPDRLI